MLAVCRMEGGAHCGKPRALLDQYLAAGGDYADIAYYRANARSMQENYAGAAEDYEAAAAAGQFREESLFAAAQCRYFAGEYERAVERLQNMCERGDRACPELVLPWPVPAGGGGERAGG